MRRRTALVATGVVMALAGAGGVVLYVFQPWRSCSYDDVSAACAMLPEDAVGLGVAALLFVVGVTVLFTGLVMQSNVKNQ